MPSHPCRARAARPIRRPRRGFTLPELLVSMVMIAVIGVALSRLIIAQSRFSNRQVLQRNARGIARGALNIMTSELRMIEQSSAFSGVSVAPTTQQIIVNVPWALGIRCAVNTVAVLPADSLSADIGLTAANSVGVAYRDGVTGRYQMQGLVTAVPTTDFSSCTGNGITATGADAMPGMRVLVLSTALTGGMAGTPVMLYYRVRYRFAPSTSVTGRLGLFRTVLDVSGGGTEEELVAPFADSSSFRYFLGNDRMPSAPPSLADVETISGVQLNLWGESELNAQSRTTPERASLSTAIFFRNRV